MGLSQNSVIEAASRDLAQYAPQQIVSPWNERGDLAKIVIPEIFGTDARLPMQRSAAMGIPAVAKARHLIAGDLAKCPLRQYDNDAEDVNQPTWATRTDGRQSPWFRMLWTVDDLVFHGLSLWGVIRGSAYGSAFGPILEAERIPFDLWDLNANGEILYDGLPVLREDVLLFTGPHEGILNMGGGAALRAMLNLEETVADRAANPVPMIELHWEGEDEPTDEEVDAALAAWAAARKARGGAVAFTPRNMRAIMHGQATDNGFMIDARNAGAVDAGRLTNVPAAMLDASNVNASLTYETLGGRNLEYKDRTLDSYASAIAARLSMDDVVPRGKRMALDLSQIIVTTPASSGAPTPD